jgi:hypothetical protein
MHKMKGQVFLVLLNIYGVLSKLICETPVICDPSLESEISLGANHFVDEAQCEASCTFGHPNNPCKFFTYVPNTQAQVPNCYKMTQCNEMSNPITGAKSGAWSCEDEAIFCNAIGSVPEYDARKTTWTCDHNVHPYGDETKLIFQDITCRTTCPSFKSTIKGHPERTDIVVSSTCISDGPSSIWSAATPADVTTSAGDTITSASSQPTPACGCEDLVLTGTVQDDEPGMVFQCTTKPEENADGNTVFTDDNICFLSCDGFQVWELYCAMGHWSLDISSASDIYCHGGGGETTTGDQNSLLTTFWPTAQH